MAWKVMLVVSATLVVFTRGELSLEEMEQFSLKARGLPNKECGEPTTFGQNIFNGTSVRLGAYPWMVAIGYTERWNGPFWRCGGSLITDQYVVTAAHCLDRKRLFIQGRPLKVALVRLGDLDLNARVDDGANPVDIPVEKVILHPDYNDDLKINDIGLIKLKNKVQFDRLKKPICLPSPEFYQNSFVDQSSLVIGFGLTEEGENTLLKEVSVEIKDIVSCRNKITSVLPTALIDERVVCASSPGKDSCQGDSGGPLMILKRYSGRAKIYLLGIVSYGYGCAKEGYPGVYTRVSHFMEWIVKNLEF